MIDSRVHGIRGICLGTFMSVCSKKFYITVTFFYHSDLVSSGVEIGESDKIEGSLLDQSSSEENLHSVVAGLCGANGPNDHPHDGTTSSSASLCEEPTSIEAIPGTSKDHDEFRFNNHTNLSSDSDLSNDAVSNPLFQVITLPDTNTSPDQNFNSGIGTTETDPREMYSGQNNERGQ